ncbi:MAG: 4Fe-4S binding protein, partial [Desulfurococcaceae archaeon]
SKSCPYNALLENTYYKVIVKHENCKRCYICVSKCPYNAIVFDREIIVKPHPYYIAIIEKLRSINGVHVVTSTYEILVKLGVIT